MRVIYFLDSQEFSAAFQPILERVFHGWTTVQQFTSFTLQTSVNRSGLVETVAITIQVCARIVFTVSWYLFAEVSRESEVGNG